MKSIAEHQYPPVSWKDGRKLLWNPIHRKALKNRPEERVRLRIIEYLTAAGWPRTRISTEEKIADYSNAGLRTDIICYNHSFEPEILVECKAENIPISPDVAEQAARYNRNLAAPYLLITNGRSDAWYRIDQSEKKTVELDTLPEAVGRPDDKIREVEYWQRRGFCGHKTGSALQRWLVDTLHHLFVLPATPPRFLNFDENPTGISLSHYYLTETAGAESTNLAWTLTGGPDGRSRLIAILSRNGENLALSEHRLEDVFGGKAANATVWTSGGALQLSTAREHLPSPRQKKGAFPLRFSNWLLEHVFGHIVG